MLSVGMIDSPPQHHGISSAVQDEAPQLSSGKLSLTLLANFIANNHKDQLNVSEEHGPIWTTLGVHLCLPSEPPR